jgi:hypothetical protein
LAVHDPFLHRLHQPIVRDRLKARGDIRLDHPAPPPPRLIDADLQGIMGRLLRAEPERARQHVGLEDRLDDQLEGRLHDAVADRGNRQRPLLGRPGLGIHTRRAGSGRQLPRFRLSASLSSSRSTPNSSTYWMVNRSMPAAPRLRRTNSHARSKTSLR